MAIQMQGQHWFGSQWVNDANALERELHRLNDQLGQEMAPEYQKFFNEFSQAGERIGILMHAQFAAGERPANLDEKIMQLQAQVNQVALAAKVHFGDDF